MKLILLITAILLTITMFNFNIETVYINGQSLDDIWINLIVFMLYFITAVCVYSIMLSFALIYKMIK